MESDDLVKDFAEKDRRVVEVYRGRIDGNEQAYYFLTTCQNYFVLADELQSLSEDLTKKTNQHFLMIHLKHGEPINNRSDLEHLIFQRTI